jgi:hypothetical protein
VEVTVRGDVDPDSGEIAPAVLHRVRLVETENNSVEYSEDGD